MPEGMTFFSGWLSGMYLPASAHSQSELMLAMLLCSYMRPRSGQVMHGPHKGWQWRIHGPAPQTKEFVGDPENHQPAEPAHASCER
jgi:hypothetical protein